MDFVFPLFNFVFTSYKWWKSEKRSEKKWTWILLVLQFYQQWRALKVINLLWKQDKRAHEKTQEMLKDVSSLEPFLEATPAFLIMTFIWFLALNPTGVGHTAIDNYYSGTLNCSDLRHLNSSENNFCAVFDGFGGPAWFFTTYTISIFTSSLGITKFLQTGPCAVLSNTGILGGILSWRFILAYICVMLSLISKAIFAAILAGFNSIVCASRLALIYSLVFFGLNILPHVIFSIVCVSLFNVLCMFIVV